MAQALSFTVTNDFRVEFLTDATLEQALRDAEAKGEKLLSLIPRAEDKVTVVFLIQKKVPRVVEVADEIEALLDNQADGNK